MSNTEYSERRYRGVMSPEGLTCYEVIIGESDLFVCTEGNLRPLALEALSRCRSDLERYLASHVTFGTSFRPVPAVGDAPEIVRDMAEAAELFDVGPMASVAGAVAQSVGVSLLARSRRVIVENGGDIFLAGGGRRKVRIFAGKESHPLDIIVEDEPGGVGVCTSSATVGPSVSLGIADAVTVLATTATIADAAATALGNRVTSGDVINEVLEFASGFEQLAGVVVLAEGSLGAWGKVEIA